MTNVESMDYTHSHPSTIASSLVPRNFCRYHKPIIYLPQNSHHTYLLRHFHSHSEIYCRATFHCSIHHHHDILYFCHIAMHDHVVDIVFMAKPPCIIFHTCHSWFIAPCRYTAGGIHIESYLVLVSSCNFYVVINKSVMIIIIRAFPKKKKRTKKKGQKKKKAQKKKKNK